MPSAFSRTRPKPDERVGEEISISRSPTCEVTILGINVSQPIISTGTMADAPPEAIPRHLPSPAVKRGSGNLPPKGVENTDASLYRFGLS
jgi:hypothetical protein